MKYIGIDIGSRSIELVVLENDKFTVFEKSETGIYPLKQLQGMLEGKEIKGIVATGYGRKLVQAHFNAHAVTEIKSYTKAVSHLHPEAKGILDIGGQDTKVMMLGDKGQLLKFEMNDKCAAGTGKFLEIMAMTLGVNLDDFGPLALKTETDLRINNTCTVFAESEVVSLVTQGEPLDKIAHAVHHTVSVRALSMMGRIIPNVSDIVFAGGVALNPAIVHFVREHSKKNIIIPKHPEYMGAIGAAIIAKEEYENAN